MVVQVHLHTILQVQTVHGRVRWLKLHLPLEATVRDAMDALKIDLNLDDMILVIDHRVVDVTAPLKNGDRLDVIPATPGG